jgi:hypothetical protein
MVDWHEVSALRDHDHLCLRNTRENFVAMLLKEVLPVLLSGNQQRWNRDIFHLR